MVERDRNVRDLSGVEGEGRWWTFVVCFEIAAPGPGDGHFSVCAWSGWSEKGGTGKYIMDVHWLLVAGSV